MERDLDALRAGFMPNLHPGPDAVPLRNSLFRRDNTIRKRDCRYCVGSYVVDARERLRASDLSSEHPPRVGREVQIAVHQRGSRCQASLFQSSLARGDGLSAHFRFSTSSAHVGEYLVATNDEAIPPDAAR